MKRTLCLILELFFSLYNDIYLSITNKWRITCRGPISRPGRYDLSSCVTAFRNQLFFIHFNSKKESHHKSQTSIVPSAELIMSCNLFQSIIQLNRTELQ